jgi:hypothetical protein
MNRQRKAFLVYVDLDPMPGLMHTTENAKAHLRDVFAEFFRPYKPNVMDAPMMAQLPQSVEDRTRKAFVVYLDLDPVPGVMHVEDNARFMAERVLTSILTTYNPKVHHAPDELQPKEGN